MTKKLQVFAPQVIQVQVHGLELKSGAGVKRKRFSKRKKVGLSDLLPKYNLLQGPQPKQHGRNNEKARSGFAVDIGRTMGIKKAAELLPSLQWLYDKINLRLSYPDLFIKHEKTGMVQINLVIEKNGLPRKGSIRISTSNHLLKVYVLQTLDKVFKQTLPQSKWLPEAMKIQLNFHFMFINPFHHYTPPSSKIVNKSLTFFRYHKQKLKVAGIETTGPDAPLGVGVDLIGLLFIVKKAYDHYQQKQNGIDPFEIYRRDPRYHGDKYNFKK